MERSRDEQPGERHTNVGAPPQEVARDLAARELRQREAEENAAAAGAVPAAPPDSSATPESGDAG